MFDNLLKGPQDQQTLRMLKEYLQNPGADLVICDEGHKLKNNETISYSKKKEIYTKRRILLTGTPIQNDLTELFHVASFVNPDLLGNEAVYKTRLISQ